MGNIELFELLETDSKTQCKACLSYWNVGIVYCTCGHFLQKETEVDRKFLNIRWNFFHSQSTLSRREDLMATDMGKSQETNHIIWLTNWRRRNAKSKSSKESMTDSYEIVNSVCEWLNIIEMKKFVSFWFQASLVYFGTITTRSWRRTIRGHLFLQAQTMAVGTKLIFHMVKLAIFLMVCLKFKKSRRR